MAVRGRPPKGHKSKSVHVAIRLTPEEVQELTARYGTPGKGLRAVLTRILGKDHPSVRAEALRAHEDNKGVGGDERVEAVAHIAEVFELPTEILEGDQTILAALPTEEPPTHLHRRGPVIATRYDRGVQVKVYACAECGKEMS